MAAVQRADVTDKEQDQLEEANFDSGIGVMATTGARRIQMRGQGGSERVATGGNINSNAGVIMPPSDAPGRNVEELQGKG